MVDKEIYLPEFYKKTAMGYPDLSKNAQRTV
jgi:hypothetical protein